MELFANILLVIQLVAALVLVGIIAVQTTKSEQGGSGMGWGTIGGQASSSFSKFGLEAKLTKITTIVAVTFFVVSFLHAWISASLLK